MYKYKNNLGISLIGTLVALALLSLFIYIFSSFFKNYYSTRSTINSSSKSLDISSSIIYEVFDSMGYLADNLGRGNCQNLTVEDILTDIYRCVCTDELCKKVSCPKVDSTRSFVTPILGVTDNDFKVMGFTGGTEPKEIALSEKFSDVYAIKPQTKKQMEANGMPRDVLNRCFRSSNTDLLPSARSNRIISQDQLDELLKEYKEKALVQEYFTLMTDLLKDDIKISQLFSQVLKDIETEDRLNMRNIFHTLERTYKDPDPRYTFRVPSSDSNVTVTWTSDSDHRISCSKRLTDNQRSDQLFTCESYGVKTYIVAPYDYVAGKPVFSNRFDLRNDEKSIIEEYTKVKNALENLKEKYSSNENLAPKIEELITLFSKTDSDKQSELDIDTNNLTVNLDVLKQKTYTYVDRNVRISQILKDAIFKRYATSFYSDYNKTIEIFTSRYNRGLEPFTTETFNVEKLYSLGKLCDTYSISACFNIQGTNAKNIDFLAGSNPRVIDSTGNEIDCYSTDHVNDPVCKDRSSIILEVKAYPMSIDSEGSIEENIPFYMYNDTGSLNRLLKMVYILHWTKKIDGKYKYFRTSGAFTMATSSNLRK